jgi:hypothetical protein
VSSYHPVWAKKFHLPALVADPVSGRLWDITKPMFFVNSLLPVDHQTLEDSIRAIAGEKDESRKDSLEGRLVAIIKEITDKDRQDSFVEWSIKISDIRTRFNEGRPDDRQVSPQWIGKRLKSMSLSSRSIHGYSEIRMSLPEYETLLKQYGYSGRETDRESAKPTNSLPENNEQNKDDWGVVGSGRQSAQVSFNSPEERDFFDEVMGRLNAEGGRTEEEKRKLAMRVLEQSRNVSKYPD